MCVYVWVRTCDADLMRMSFFTAENDMLLMLVCVCVFVRAQDGMSDLELVLTMPLVTHICVWVYVCKSVFISLCPWPVEECKTQRSWSIYPECFAS